MNEGAFTSMCQWIGGLLGFLAVFWIFIKEKQKEQARAEDLLYLKKKTASMEKLEEPCQIIFIRPSSFAAALNTFSVFLNGSEVGEIKNGDILKFSTDYAKNEITLGPDTNYPPPLHFNAKPGGKVHIQYKGGGKLKLVSIE